MKTSSLSFLMIVLLAGCTPANPIDRVVQKESSNQYFPSGMSALINLPATASPAQVASSALGESLTNITIMKIRPVRIVYKDMKDVAKEQPDLFNYTAVLVDTKSGQKVVLLQYNNHARLSGWWSGVYDIQ
jgi:hypothetical protein